MIFFTMGIGQDSFEVLNSQMKGTGFDPRCLPVGIPEQAAWTPQRLLANDIYIKETPKLLWKKEPVGGGVATRVCYHVVSSTLTGLT